LEYRILRGARQIGGTVTEINTDAGTRIWIDFGCELSVDEDKSTDRMLVGRMQNPDTRPDVIFFTHIHGDHIGLLSKVADGVDIVMSEIGKKMMDNIGSTLMEFEDLETAEREKLEKQDEILNCRNGRTGRVFFYENCIDSKPDIDSKPNNDSEPHSGSEPHSDSEPPYDSIYPARNGEQIRYRALKVDHSVYGAYMLRFEIDGKVLVHTGDYRSHGRMGEELIDDIKAAFCREGDRNDILITEGTMMSRSAEKVMTEDEMKAEATRILKKHKYAFLVCSSTNLDSLASFYWATVFSSDEGKKKPFLCNSYVKRQLALFTREIGEAEGKREYRFYRSYPIMNGLQKRLSNGKTQFEHIRDEGFLMMIGSRDYYYKYLEMFAGLDEKPVLIYSMWGGYLEENKPYSSADLIKLRKKISELGFDFEELHTSGHATVETIAEVIEAIDPQEVIVPIHTEKPENFKKELKKLEIKGKSKMSQRHLDMIMTAKDVIVPIDRYQMPEAYKELTISGQTIPYSSKIDIELTGKKCKIKLSDTTANMQTDANNFESLAAAIWSIDREIEIELEYPRYAGDKDNAEDNRGKPWDALSLKAPCYKGKNGSMYAEPARLHYFRLLYRVMRFREMFGGDDTTASGENRGGCIVSEKNRGGCIVSEKNRGGCIVSEKNRGGFVVSEKNTAELDAFMNLYEEALHTGKLWITRPTTKGALKGYDKKTGEMNTAIGITENHLEKWFALHAGNDGIEEGILNIPEGAEFDFASNGLFDQLPCTMFCGEPSSESRIFNSGFFDLWGINNSNELCLFELKERSNTKLGIISELFFYAMVMKDMQRARGEQIGGKKDYRGYGAFRAADKEAKINAYFLVPELHPFLEDGDNMKKVLEVLNEGSMKRDVRFDCIFFAQERIVDVEDAEDRRRFLRRLSREWQESEN